MTPDERVRHNFLLRTTNTRSESRAIGNTIFALACAFERLTDTLEKFISLKDFPLDQDLQ